MVDYKAIGERIKTTRKQKKITQENIAEYLDISITYMSKLERGVEKINLKTLVKIAALLEVPPSFLLDGIAEIKNSDYLHNDLNEIIKKYNPNQMKLLLKISKNIAEFED